MSWKIPDEPPWEARKTPTPPSADILLAACEAMAMLIHEEYPGTIAENVYVHADDATLGHVEAVKAVEAYWAAVKPQEA